MNNKKQDEEITIESKDRITEMNSQIAYITLGEELKQINQLINAIKNNKQIKQTKEREKDSEVLENKEATIQTNNRKRKVIENNKDNNILISMIKESEAHYTLTHHHFEIKKNVNKNVAALRSGMGLPWMTNGKMQTLTNFIRLESHLFKHRNNKSAEEITTAEQLNKNKFKQMVKIQEQLLQENNLKLLKPEFQNEELFDYVIKEYNMNDSNKQIEEINKIKNDLNNSKDQENFLQELPRNCKLFSNTFMFILTIEWSANNCSFQPILSLFLNVQEIFKALMSLRASNYTNLDDRELQLLNDKHSQSLPAVKEIAMNTTILLSDLENHLKHSSKISPGLILKENLQELSNEQKKNKIPECIVRAREIVWYLIGHVGYQVAQRAAVFDLENESKVKTNKICNGNSYIDFLAACKLELPPLNEKEFKLGEPEKFFSQLLETIALGFNNSGNCQALLDLFKIMSISNLYCRNCNENNQNYKIIHSLTLEYFLQKNPITMESIITSFFSQTDVEFKQFCLCIKCQNVLEDARFFPRFTWVTINRADKSNYIQTRNFTEILGKAGDEIEINDLLAKSKLYQKYKIMDNMKLGNVLQVFMIIYHVPLKGAGDSNSSSATGHFIYETLTDSIKQHSNSIIVNGDEIYTRTGLNLIEEDIKDKASPKNVHAIIYKRLEKKEI
jgi:hypothetical protein